jgi:hypothetical protein
LSTAISGTPERVAIDDPRFTYDGNDSFDSNRWRDIYLKHIKTWVLNLSLVHSEVDKDMGLVSRMARKDLNDLRKSRNDHLVKMKKKVWELKQKLERHVSDEERRVLEEELEKLENETMDFSADHNMVWFEFYFRGARSQGSD